jgi:hypothetical protein
LGNNNHPWNRRRGGRNMGMSCNYSKWHSRGEGDEAKIVEAEAEVEGAKEESKGNGEEVERKRR